MSVNKSKFSEAVEAEERQQRLDAWAGMVAPAIQEMQRTMGPMPYAGATPAQAVARLAYDVAEALEAERARRLGKP